MRRTENPEMRRKLLNHLASQYKIKEIREPNHLSSFVGCRTRTFFDQQQAIEPTDDEVMMFALGYGLQDVLTPEAVEEGYYDYKGVLYRPDMNFEANPSEIAKLLEMKTTRRSAKYHYIDTEIPVTWTMYMKGGCKITGTTTYDLAVLYMMGNYAPPFPQLYCDKFYFNQDEIDENWQIIMRNKEVLDNAIELGKPPEPFAHCFGWECKFCRYKLMCQVLSPI